MQEVKKLILEALTDCKDAKMIHTQEKLNTALKILEETFPNNHRTMIIEQSKPSKASILRKIPVNYMDGSMDEFSDKNMRDMVYVNYYIEPDAHNGEVYITNIQSEDVTGFIITDYDIMHDVEEKNGVKKVHVDTIFTNYDMNYEKLI